MPAAQCPVDAFAWAYATADATGEEQDSVTVDDKIDENIAIQVTAPLHVIVPLILAFFAGSAASERILEHGRDVDVVVGGICVAIIGAPAVGARTRLLRHRISL